MPTILFYSLIALVVLGIVVLAVPEQKSAPPPSPRDVMLQLKQ